MAHIPINHHLRPAYRALAGLIGLYGVTLGGYGLVKAGGVGVFQQSDLPRVLGLPVNPAFAVLSLALGGVLLLGALIGGNAAHYVNLAAGAGYLVVGLAMLLLLRTDANVLGFSVSSCVVAFLLGLGTLTAGLYGKVGPDRPAAAERPSVNGRAPQRA